MDFKRPLLTVAGSALKGGEESVTVGMALLPAIMGTWPGDQRSPGRKARDVALGLEIVRGMEVTLGDEDRGHLRDVAFATVPGAYFFVQIAEALGFTVDELKTP